MTEEQINNLKVGDKFTVEYTVASIEPLCEGELYVRVNQFDVLMQPFPTKSGKTLQAATLVTPPPVFEVGDTVRVVPDPLTGRAYNCFYRIDKYVGKTGIVKSEENGFGAIYVDMEDVEESGRTYVNVHCLELVKKAVKDKYCVHEFELTFGVCPIENQNEYNGAIAVFCKNVHPNAKEAAEAECKRLNEKWRKQQKENM